MVNKKIKLVFKCGPLGDETSLYEVMFPDGLTIKDFVEIAVLENPEEWGNFRCSWFGPIIAEYEHGKIEYTKEFEEIKDKIVHRASSTGGWSRMDYHLTIF